MNKLVLAQINTIAGNIDFNAKKIQDCINKAIKNNIDLIVFPKNALIGFPYGNIIERHKSILTRQDNAIKELMQNKNITIVLDCIKNNETVNVVIKNGEILYNPQTFELNNEVFGFEVSNNIQTLIIKENSESRTGKEFTKNKELSALSKENDIKVIYVNQVGYADNFVFAGISRVYINGELVLRSKAFEEDFAVLENNKGNIEPLPVGMEKEVSANVFNLDYENDLERTYKSCVLAIKDYFNKNGFKKAVLGLSGGLDSTISVVLLVDALGKENVFGVSMPSRITSQGSKDDARILAENLGISFFEMPLANALDPMKNILKECFNNVEAEKYTESTTIENLQARTRATILWSIANEHKGMLPIATSDKSEAYIGYATVNGDMSGGFAPLTDITKTKLFALGHYLNKVREVKNAIPEAILEKPPGAELKINPKTGKTVCAEEANMPYPFLDEIIWMVENFGYGFDDLMKHNFYYEKSNELTQEQKKEWINKFFWKQHCAVFKWHIIPPAIIGDMHSINNNEYHQPIISKVF